jgi:hypothetical protein
MVRQKYNIEHFKKLAEEKGGKCLSDEYINTKSILKLECNKGHIWTTRAGHLLEGTWCKECSKITNRKYTVDNSFFSNDNELSFYVAGFFLADATKSDRGQTYKIRLRLARKDLDHLEKIKDILKCTSPIKLEEKYHYKINGRILDKTYYLCGFGFASKQCYNDLERFGVIKNKTHYTKISDQIINSPYINHFLRGLIDGDGCFTMDKKTVTFRLDGTKELLGVVHKIFLDNNICDKKNKRKDIEDTDKKFTRLMYGGNGILSRMYDFLYKDATIFMNRKEEVCRRSKLLGKGKLWQ